MKDNEYVDEKSLKFELTVVNLKEKYKNGIDVVEEFNKRVQERKEEIQELIQNLTEKEITQRTYLEEELKYLEQLTIEKQNKSRVGLMILLIIKNLARKPCFAGYTNNWKDEFYSKAIENCLKYIHNFDENKISDKTGKQIKAFAYITQIAYMSFIATINDRKKEEEKLNLCKSLDDNKSLIDKNNIYSNKNSTFNFQYILGIENNILENLEIILQKIQEFKKITELKNEIEMNLYTYMNNSKDNISTTEIQEEMLKVQDYFTLYQDLKSFLKIDYIPEIIELYIIKNNSNLKSKINSLANEYNYIIYVNEISEEEFKKLKKVHKKIMDIKEEEW